MSRLGKKPISIPKGVTVNKNDGRISVKGPLGELTRNFKPEVAISTTPELITLSISDENDKTLRALWGTYASHLENMIEGVTKGYVKKLIIEGTGYKGVVAGTKLTLSLGYSHPIELQIPSGLKVEMVKSEMTISGFDKELLGHFAAKVRSYREPEPYKGKGVRYSDEVIVRKQGKRAVA